MACENHEVIEHVELTNQKQVKFRICRLTKSLLIMVMNVIRNYLKIVQLNIDTSR